MVSLESPSSVEYRIKKIFFFNFRFLQGVIEVKSFVNIRCISAVFIHIFDQIFVNFDQIFVNFVKKRLKF